MIDLLREYTEILQWRERQKDIGKIAQCPECGTPAPEDELDANMGICDSCMSEWLEEEEENTIVNG